MNSTNDFKTPGGENPYSVEKRVKALVYTIEECVACKLITQIIFILI